MMRVGIMQIKLAGQQMNSPGELGNSIGGPTEASQSVCGGLTSQANYKNVVSKT